MDRWTPSGMKMAGEGWRQLVVSGFTEELLSLGLMLPGNHPNLQVTLKRLENTTGSAVFTLKVLQLQTLTAQ